MEINRTHPSQSINQGAAEEFDPKSWSEVPEELVKTILLVSDTKISFSGISKDLKDYQIRAINEHFSDKIDKSLLPNVENKDLIPSFKIVAYIRQVFEKKMEEAINWNKLETIKFSPADKEKLEALTKERFMQACAEEPVNKVKFIAALPFSNSSFFAKGQSHIISVAKAAVTAEQAHIMTVNKAAVTDFSEKEKFFWTMIDDISLALTSEEEDKEMKSFRESRALFKTP